MLPAHFTLYKEHHTYTLFRLELTPSLPALFLRPRKFSPPLSHVLLPPLLPGK